MQRQAQHSRVAALPFWLESKSHSESQPHPLLVAHDLPRKLGRPKDKAAAEFVQPIAAGEDDPWRVKQWSTDGPSGWNKVEGVLDTLNQGVIITDDCRKIVYANELFLEMVGRSREEMLGKTQARTFSPPRTADSRSPHRSRTSRRP